MVENKPVEPDAVNTAVGIMKKFYLILAAALVCGSLSAQDVEKTEKLDSVVVSSTRADKHTPVTYSSLGKEELRSSSTTNSVPMVLNLQPSVVTYNEGGNGLGNSAMTIRGSKGSQINVTLNGVTLNDAESQEVFWVNIPALSSFISSVQLQRGLGTSSAGSGAFGASVNMNTASVSAQGFGNVEFSAGSWNTFQTTAASSSGLGKNGFYLNSAVSIGHTDGYIRNGKVNSSSGFLSAGWLGDGNSFRFTYLLGDQKSGITWDGIDPEQYKTDRRSNNAGAYYDADGNLKYYDNQIDRYAQHHLQFNWTTVLGRGIVLSNTINYTRGDGYDEYFKQNAKFASFGFAPVMMGEDGAEHSRSDMIYRKEMGNDYYLVKSDLRIDRGALSLYAGASASHYVGNHFGSVLWAETLGEAWNYKAFNDASSWYRSRDHKVDASAFVRAEVSVCEGLTGYADLQYRHINYKILGRDNDYPDTGLLMDFRRKWDFFNPRAGLSWKMNDLHRVYASVAIGHREPGRGDIKSNIKGGLNPIGPEKMMDYEFGYVYSGKAFAASATIYLMEYKDILLETGKLSDSGYAIKENVPEGYRRGLELAGAWMPAFWLKADANLTLSVNKILDYTEYIPYTDYSTVYEADYGDTQMLLSPSVVGMGRLVFTPWGDGTSFTVSAKYVGKEYIDNTERDLMKIPARCTVDLSANKEFKLGKGFMGLTLYVNNVLNHKYFAYGWRYEEYDPAADKIISQIGIYPQATTNFTVKLSYRF